MDNQLKDKPFFIGWESKPAKPIGAFLKKATVFLLVTSFVIAGVVTATQQTVSNGKFEFGNVKEFSGVFVKTPTPMLITEDELEGENIFYLVSPMKNGFPADVAEKLHLQQVTLKGTFINDDLEAMIEVVEGSATVSGTGPASEHPLKESDQGEVTVQGEIVDAKCHLGVMNPGRFKPHRACAIQCLSGGIPPILVAKTSDGQLAHYLLVGSDGSTINDEVLEYAAEPVEVSGTLKLIGDRKVLYIVPQTIKRL